MHRSLPKGRDARAALQPSSFPRHFICMQYRELDVLHPFAWSNFIFVRNDETRTRGIWARETAHYFWRERESSIFIEEFWKKKKRKNIAVLFMYCSYLPLPCSSQCCLPIYYPLVFQPPFVFHFLFFFREKHGTFQRVCVRVFACAPCYIEAERVWKEACKSCFFFFFPQRGKLQR